MALKPVQPPPLIRPYAPGDEEQIIALYRIVFKFEMSVPAWRWYYEGPRSAPRPRTEMSPDNPKAVIVVAEASDGSLIGHYAVQMRPFCFKGQSCLAGLVVGSMVAPEHRNITTFIEMAKMAYELCRARGVPFVYAFPNDNVWLVRRRMLDWQALPSLFSMAAPLSELHVSNTHDSFVRRLSPMEPFPSAKWLTDCHPENIRALFPAEYLNWRFFEKPGGDYPVYAYMDRESLIGYIALKRYVGNDGVAVGHIVGWDVAPGTEPTVGAALFAQAKAHFAADGVSRVSLWLLPTSPLTPLIQNAGMKPEEIGKNFGYLAISETLKEDVSLSGPWDIRMADSDVY